VAWLDQIERKSEVLSRIDKDAIVKDSSGRVGVVLDNPDSDLEVILR
jgi:hypothetical protein